MRRSICLALTSVAALALLATPRLAHAEDTAAPSSMYAGILLGPGVPIEPSGDTLFWFGAEFGIKSINIPILLNPQSGLFKIRTTPKFMYDISVIPKLTISPFGGLDFMAGFGDLTLIQVGLTVGARATFMVTPKIGVFAEPATFDLPLFQYASFNGQSESKFDFRIAYRAMLGVNYRF